MSELQLMVPAYSWYSQQIKNCDEQAQLAPCFTKRWPSQPCNVYLKSHDMAQGATNAKEIAEKGKVTCRKKKQGLIRPPVTAMAQRATYHSHGPKSHQFQVYYFKGTIAMKAVAGTVFVLSEPKCFRIASGVQLQRKHKKWLTVSASWFEWKECCLGHGLGSNTLQHGPTTQPTNNDMANNHHMNSVMALGATCRRATHQSMS